jgi:hypothetical protein
MDRKCKQSSRYLKALTTPQWPGYARCQHLSDRAAGLIAARNRLAEAEEAERAARGSTWRVGRRWRSAGPGGCTVDGDGHRLIPV